MSQLTKIQSESLSRSATFERASVNEDQRTVELSFSSEEPVERWFGIEVLGHDASNVDLGRLANGGAVLMDHNHRDQVGVVESVEIDGNERKGRAVVRFGKSARAEEVYQDVKDGIRQNVSVGYRIMEAERTAVEDDVETWTATRWQPFEISLVSVPADSSVGVGRSFEEQIESKQEAEMSTEKNKPEANQENPINVDDVRSQAVAAEQQRAKTITVLGKEHGMRDMADKYIADGRTVDEMKDAVLTQAKERSVSKTITQAAEAPKTEIGLTGAETQRFSMMKAVRALATGNWDDAGFERDCSLAVADKLGKEARGLYVPMEVQRAMGTAAGTGISDAGALVGTDHMDSAFIDALRAESLVGQLGARFMDGLVGDLDIPRLDSGSTFGWITEDADAADSEGTLGSVLMSPKTIAGAVPMTRKLLKQSSPSVEAIMRQDLIRGAALAIDVAALNGSGAAGQPLGILNQTGVNTQTVADITNKVPTFAELIGYETKLADDNALIGNLNYITTPAINAALKTAAKDAGSGIMLVENGMANGYSVYASTQVPVGKMVFGNFSDVMIGMWGVLDLTVDTATKAASGGLVLRAFQDVDVAIRHPESFCVTA